MSAAKFDPASTDWNLVRSFVAVVDHGSLTRAAAQLGVSQPTLSRQIAELELAIGAALFERVARGLKLTRAGANLVDPARHMLTAARALGMAAASQGDALGGTVRITASEIVSAFVLPTILAALARRHPDIEVELVASNQIGNLLEREADIAIRMVRPTQAALIARHIATWPMGFYAHAAYLARVGTPPPAVAAGNARELARFRWIGYDQSDQMIAGFKAAGASVDRAFFAFRSDNHLVNWQALLAGVGIGVGLCWLADRHPELVQVLPEQALPSLPVWLTTHRELKASQRLRTVFDFLGASLARVDTA